MTNRTSMWGKRQAGRKCERCHKRPPWKRKSDHYCKRCFKYLTGPRRNLP